MHEALAGEYCLLSCVFNQQYVPVIHQIVTAGKRFV